MRTNLIMHFHCAECGSVLNLVYDKDVKVKPEEYRGGWAATGHTPEPTGAAVRYVPPVFIEPCRGCIDKHTGPAKQLAAALKTMAA
jgi:hypothetical protein